MSQFLVSLLLQLAGSIDWSQILDVAAVRAVIDSVLDAKISACKAAGQLFMARIWQCVKALVDSPAWDSILQLLLRQNATKLQPAVAACLASSENMADSDLHAAIASACPSSSELVA